MTSDVQARLSGPVQATGVDVIAAAWKAHLSPAFHARCRMHAGVYQPGTSTASVPTCEKVPTSDGGPDEELAEETLNPPRVTDAAETIRASIDRSRDRQRRAIALIGAGEVAHAKRLVKCGRQSVELQCAGYDGCGQQNYVAISCDSRLCPDCAKKRQGRAVGRYKGVVDGWENPTMLRFSLPERVNPQKLKTGIDTLREAFGNLRRRVIQPTGRHQQKRWVWKNDDGQPADHYWKSALMGGGERRLAKRLEMKYVREGRGIPVDELMRSGFYGIDIKEKEDGRLNVHMHVLADMSFIPQAALASLWDDLVGAPVIDVRRVEERGEQGAESAAMEVVGYAAKAPEFESLENEVAYLQALKGSKLIQPFGALHGNTPRQDHHLYCNACDRSPELDWRVEWAYNGVVDGRYETAVVGGPDGPKPPPEEDA